MKKLRALVLASISGFVVPPVSSVSAESPTPIEVRVIGYSVNNEPLIAKRFGTPGGRWWLPSDQFMDMKKLAFASCVKCNFNPFPRSTTSG